MSTQGIDYNGMLFDVQAKLSRKVGRRVYATEMTAMLGYLATSALVGYMKGGPVTRKEVQWKLVQLTKMLDGELEWPQGVVWNGSSLLVNAQVMRAWYEAGWDEIAGAEKALKVQAKIKKIQARVAKVQHFAKGGSVGAGGGFRWAAPREVYDALTSIERRMDTLEAAVNALLREWRGPKEAA